MGIDRATFVISYDPPDRDSKRSDEGEHGARVRVAHEPEDALPPHLTLRHGDRLVDVEVGSARVASELAREDQAQDRKRVVRRRKDPRLERAARRRQTRRPRPHELVHSLEHEHDEGRLEKLIQLAQVRSEDEDLSLTTSAIRIIPFVVSPHRKLIATYTSEREHERVDVSENDNDQAEDGQECPSDRLDSCAPGLS